MLVEELLQITKGETMQYMLVEELLQITEGKTMQKLTRTSDILFNIFCTLNLFMCSFMFS